MLQAESKKSLTRRDFLKISALVGAGSFYSLTKHIDSIPNTIEDEIEKYITQMVISKQKEPYTNLRITSDNEKLNDRCVAPASQHKEYPISGTNPYFRAINMIFDWLGNHGQAFLTIDENTNLSLKTISHVWNSVVSSGCFAIRIPGKKSLVFDVDMLKSLNSKFKDDIISIPITQDYEKYIKEETRIGKIIPLVPLEKHKYTQGSWRNAFVPHTEIPDYFSPVKIFCPTNSKYLGILSLEKIIEPGYSGSPILEADEKERITGKVLGSLSTGGIFNTEMREKLMGERGAFFSIARTFN